MLGTITRAGGLLDLFTPQTPEWGATAAGRELGIAKSQAHELLTSLTAIGLLRRAPGGQFRLGWRMLALGRELLNTQFPDEILEPTRGLIRTLSRALEEPVQLVVLDRRHLTTLAHRPGRRGTDALIPRAELDNALHACAMSKCLLADLRSADLRGCLPAQLPRRTAATIVDLEALRIELATVRRQGVAFDRGEVADGLRAVAVPLRDATGATVAALGVWTQKARWATAQDEITRAVIGVGHRIETVMRSQTAVNGYPAQLAAAS